MTKTITPNHLLRNAREAHHWTQQQLAEKLAVGVTTVRSWEAGRRFPSRPLRSRLCELFQMPPENLGLAHMTDRASLVPAPHEKLLLPDVSSPSGMNLAQLRSFLLFRQEVDQNRRRFLARVRNKLMDGAKTDSLCSATSIPLDLMDLPEAVATPWRLSAQATEASSQVLPAGTSIAEVYKKAEGELLLLGDPGSGKTTLLLELACVLLQQAEESKEKPMPIMLHLSSWSGHTFSLEEWVVEELYQKYRVPKNIGKEWVETDQLALLLDGLDEAPEEARHACVQAIIAYRQDHNLTPLVVSCQRETYFAIDVCIPLRRAVLLRPLTREQIEEYFLRANGQFEAIRRAIWDDPELLDMIRSPLMLNIVALTYQGDHATLVLAGSKAEQRQQIFHTYVQRMLTRRSMSPYQPQQTFSWLSWLARQMQRSQVDFSVERLQPAWLSEQRLRDSYQSAMIRLTFGIESAVFAGLFAWLRGGKVGNVFGVGKGLLGWLGAGSGNAALGWMAPGLGAGVAGGRSLAIILALVYTLVTLLVGASMLPTLSPKVAIVGVGHGIRTGTLYAAIIGFLGFLVFTLRGGIRYGLMYGLGTGLISGLVAGLLSGLIAGLHYHPTIASSRQENSEKKRPVGTRFMDGAMIGLSAFVSFISVDTLLHINLASSITYGVIVSGFFCITFSLGGGTDLIPGLGKEIVLVEATAWSWAQVRQDLGHNLLKGGIIGSTVTLCVGVVLGGTSAAFYGSSYGLRYSLVYGLIVGIIVGIAGILAGILKSGWNSQRLAEHQQFRPNEGVIRSAWHGVVAACIFGPIGAVTSGIACALVFLLVGGLVDWLALGVGFGLIFGITFALEFALLQGGIAWIAHYLLRWYLWRAGRAPMNYVAFLDYAVEHLFLQRTGGEYAFVHRLLMNYFASLPARKERAWRLFPNDRT